MLPRADKLELITEATLAQQWSSASPAIASHPKRGVALVAS
jgi:hypothetical protein